jgi:tRNA (cytidine/uridine-2'-O-)-methyltransferase
MFNIVLHQPEIPPNTGNIMRLCANTGFKLHLIKPLGFTLSDKTLKRAKLDYVLLDSVQTYENFNDFEKSIPESSEMYLSTTKAEYLYTDMMYKPETYFVFGSETSGLPREILDHYSARQKIKIPMTTTARSLNLSNAVAIIVYEAWRQNGFG